jgi:hypothetical protein
VQIEKQTQERCYKTVFDSFYRHTFVFLPKTTQTQIIFVSKDVPLLKSFGDMHYTSYGVVHLNC